MFKLASIILFALFLCCQCDQLYSREYQFQLYDNRFDNSRAQGVDYYFSNWGNAAGVDYETLEEIETVRRTTTIQLNNCGSGDFMRKRDYIYGDRNDVTLGLKSAGSLTESEALNENFDVAPEYEESNDYFIEYDVHPCESDWVANSRIYLTTSPDFFTCSDVHDYFPDAVENSNNDVDMDESGSVEYVIYRNGPYLDGSVSLAITLTYPSLQDAIDDTNRGSGEFSYTFFGTPDISSADADELDFVHEQLLSSVGSEDNYPCDSESNVSSNVSTNNESSSAQSIVFSFGLLILSVMLF
mmetsp:Transcript_16720/g.28446  ORF Transcript_16720/g.28446 Transcript_16720/m.28446 type:complete len:299 (+) Transcript_16720:40-936(+)